MTQKILIILSLLATISCASFNAPLDSRLDSDKKKGLAVFSFTSQGVFNNFFLQYRSISGDFTGDITQWTVYNPLDWEGLTRGRLVTLDFPIGEYELYRLVNHKSHSKNNFSIGFAVIPGKAIYFGNVHIDIPDQKKYSINISDQSDRDIDLFLSKYKNISKINVVKRISTLKTVR